MKCNIRFVFQVNVSSFVYCFIPIHYTHLHTSMMLMQCFSKKLYSVTPRVLQGTPQTHEISYDSQYNPKYHRSRVLRRVDGSNLSNSCVSIVFLFSITRISAVQSIFMGYPSEDYRRYSVDRNNG